MSKEFREIVHKHSDELEYLARYLSNQASSFWQTGNDYMGDKLSNIADRLFEMSEEIKEGHRKEIEIGWQQSQQSSANMLNALLAGHELGKKEVK